MRFRSHPEKKEKPSIHTQIRQAGTINVRKSFRELRSNLLPSIAPKATFATKEIPEIETCGKYPKREENLLPVIMGAKTLSAPMKVLRADLAAKRINYNNNPLLKWALTNLAVEVDKNENIRPVKGQNKRQRIDPAVALIIAYTVLQWKLEDYKALI